MRHTHTLLKNALKTKILAEAFIHLSKPFTRVFLIAANKIGRDVKHNLQSTSADITYNVTSYASKKPYKFLGFAAVTGFVLGMFMKK